MTREQVEELLVALENTGHFVKAQFFRDHDAEQRQVIDEQVEENRGLRSDVLLMQKVNADQRAEIERLRDALYGIIVNCEGSDDAVLLKMQMRAFALNVLEQKEERP